MQISTKGDAYHWYPLFTADGGYAFAQNADGSYNPADMGIGKEGSIAAAKRLQQLAKDNVIKASVTYDIARETFGKGKSPYFITGPWQVPEQQKALGDKLMICPDAELGGQHRQVLAVPRRAGVHADGQGEEQGSRLDVPHRRRQTTEFMDGMYSVDPAAARLARVLRQGLVGPDRQGVRRLRPAGRPDTVDPADGHSLGDLASPSTRSPSGRSEATMTKAGEDINKANQPSARERTERRYPTRGGSGSGGRSPPAPTGPRV